MLEALKSFLRGFGRILWMCTRYLLVCSLAICAMISLATGKFPPPVFEMYKNLRSLRSATDLIQATSKLAMAHEQQKQVMVGIEDPSVSGDSQAGMNLPPDMQLQKIKALEYEVASLKAKLARAQWEARQAQQQQETPQVQVQEQEQPQQQPPPQERQTASSQP